MKNKYNYILLNEGFHNWLEANYLPGLAQFIFLKLIHLFNVAGWSEWVQVDNQKLMVMVQIKREQTFIEHRDKLIERGLIIFSKGKKGSPNKYKLNDKFTFIKEAKIVAKNVAQPEMNNEINAGAKTEIYTEDIYKQNKTKQNKKKDLSLATLEIDGKNRDAISEREKPKTPKKHKYGEYKNVLLTDEEYEKLIDLCGDDLQGVIEHLSDYIEMKGYKARSHYLAIRKWVIPAYKEQMVRYERAMNLARAGGAIYGGNTGNSPKKLCTEYPE